MAREKEEEEQRRLEEERKANSPLNKALKWFKKTANKLTEPE